MIATNIKLLFLIANIKATNKPTAADIIVPVTYNAAGKVIAANTVYGI